MCATIVRAVLYAPYRVSSGNCYTDISHKKTKATFEQRNLSYRIAVGLRLKDGVASVAYNTDDHVTSVVCNTRSLHQGTICRHCTRFGVNRRARPLAYSISQGASTHRGSNPQPPLFCKIVCFVSAAIWHLISFVETFILFTIIFMFTPLTLERFIQVFLPVQYTAFCYKMLKTRTALNSTPMTELRDVTCYMGSHSVTCYPTQVNAPRPNPRQQAGTRFIYLPQRDGRLSWPRLPGNAPAGSRTAWGLLDHKSDASRPNHYVTEPLDHKPHSPSRNSSFSVLRAAISVSFQLRLIFCKSELIV